MLADDLYRLVRTREIVIEQTALLEEFRDYLTEALNAIGEEPRPRYERQRQLIKDDIAKLDAMVTRAKALP
jgi:hypothetical protein